VPGATRIEAAIKQFNLRSFCNFENVSFHSFKFQIVVSQTS
jgi:hypothetical protein